MLLKVGVAMMAAALAFAAVVAVAVFLFAEPTELATAVKSTTRPALKPLIRSDPGVDPWVERNIPAPRPEPEPEAVAAPQPDSDPQPKPEPQPGTETRATTRTAIEAGTRGTSRSLTATRA